MAVKFTNNAKTTLASGITSTATSATVVDGSVFPTLGAGEYFYCTFDDTTNNEIVKVTARSGNTLTIVRGVDNTTARAFSSGDAAELRATAGLLTDIQENIAAKSANQTVYNTTTASSATDYDIGIDPSVEANAMVFLNGVMQHHDTFSFSGSTLTFDTAPSDGMALEVIVDNLINLQSSNLTVDTFTAADVGGNPQTDFTLSDSPAAETNLIVFVDGVFQDQDAYTISTNVLTMTDGVIADRVVTVYVINPVNIGTPSDGTVTSAKLSGNITMPGSLTVTSYDVAFDSPTFVVDNANSRVGIGTAAPTTLLDIVGDVKMSAGLQVSGIDYPTSDGTNGQVLTTDGAGTLSFSTISGYTDSDVETYLNTSTIYTDPTNNRLGIGTSSPQDVLHIKNSTQAVGDAQVILEGRPAGYGTGISFQAELTGGSLKEMARIVADGSAAWNTTTTTQDARLRFFTTNDGTESEKMVISHDGNVGINGTPTAKLAVVNNSNDATYTVKQYATFGTGSTWLDSDVVNQHGGGIGEVQITNGEASRPAVLSLGGTLATGELMGAISFFRSSNTDGYRQRASMYSTVNTTGTANQHGGDLRFSTAADGATNPTERMRIHSTGDVTINSDGNKSALDGVTGIGVQIGNASSSAAGLAFQTSNRGYMWYVSGTNFDLWDSNANVERLRINSSGILSSGTGTGAGARGNNIINWTARNWIGITGDLPGYANADYPVLKTPYDYMYISVNGSYSAYIQGNGSYTANSDERLKTNITTLPSGQLDKVANLRGVNFEWLDTNRGEGQQLGVIAQEIEAEYPELVTEGVEDIKGVNYAGLVVPLIEAVKELKTKLEAAEARITELENN